MRFRGNYILLEHSGHIYKCLHINRNWNEVEFPWTANVQVEGNETVSKIYVSLILIDIIQAVLSHNLEPLLYGNQVSSTAQMFFEKFTFGICEYCKSLCLTG
jgi:hypothetical protein